MRADGCLRFLGRYKDMLKVGGENVDPMEIEGFLLEDPRINTSPWSGCRTPAWKRPRRLRHPGSRRDAERAGRPRAYCRGQLASFKIPRQVFFVDQFPMTSSGKIQKYLLREEAERLSTLDQETTRPEENERIPSHVHGRGSG